MMNQSVRVCDAGKEGLPHTVVREGFLRRCLGLNLDEEKEPGSKKEPGQQEGARAARQSIWLELNEGGGEDERQVRGFNCPRGMMGTM